MGFGCLLISTVGQKDFGYELLLNLHIVPTGACAYDTQFIPLYLETRTFISKQWNSDGNST